MMEIIDDLLGIIIPMDFHIFQRGGPTTNQIVFLWFCCSDFMESYSDLMGFYNDLMGFV